MGLHDFLQLVIDRNGIVRYAVEHYAAGGPPRGLLLDRVFEETRNASK